jgi:hypothetical protein
VIEAIYKLHQLFVKSLPRKEFTQGAGPTWRSTTFDGNSRMIYLLVKISTGEDQAEHPQGHSRDKEDECHDGVAAVNVQGEVLGHACHIRIPGGHRMNIGNKESQT